MAILFPTTLKLEIDDDILANEEEMAKIIEDISNTKIDSVLSSQINFKAFITNGLYITKALKNGTNIDSINQAIIDLFRIMVKLRERLTGEVYVLNVETQKGTSIEANLDNLFEKEAIIFNRTDGQIEYKLQDLKNQIKEIKIHSQLYQNLTEKIFRQSVVNNKASLFIYYHDDNSYSVGRFFEHHFANYMAENKQLEHYFIKDRNGVRYTKSTASYYNRGQIYEWYIEDLNTLGYSKMKTIATNPVEFMLRHSKDNISFLRSGDIVRKRNQIIEAVQVKRFNNAKLITSQQIESTLMALNNLTTSRLTKEKAKNAILKAFTPQNLQGKQLRQETIRHIEQKSDELFDNWAAEVLNKISFNI